MSTQVTTAATGSLWEGGRSPYLTNSKKFGMWLFIISDALTFSALLFAYTYSRVSNPDWPKPFSAAEVANLQRAGYNAGFASLEDSVRRYVTQFLDRADRYRHGRNADGHVAGGAAPEQVRRLGARDVVR